MFHTTVFTFLGLLYNLCMCKQLKWKVMAASDGTDNTTNNNWQLLTMGCFSINSKGAQQYQPFFFILASGERQEIIGLGVLALLKYSRCLFNIKTLIFWVASWTMQQKFSVTYSVLRFPAPNYWLTQHISEGKYQWERVMVLTASMWTQKYSLLIQSFMMFGTSPIVWMIQFFKYTKSWSKGVDSCR